jgi:hypothetical protein
LRDDVFRQRDIISRSSIIDIKNASMVNNKIAPEIVKNIELPELLKKNTFICFTWEKINKWRKRYSISERLKHYRARRIASWKVLMSLKDLYDNHSIFKNSEIIKNIYCQYQEWHKSTEKELERINDDYPEISEKIRLSFIKKTCLRQEKKSEISFFENGFISEKIKKNIDEMIEAEEIRETKESI